MTVDQHPRLAEAYRLLEQAREVVIAEMSHTLQGRSQLILAAERMDSARLHIEIAAVREEADQ